MTLGIQNKRVVGLLGVLMLGMAYSIYTNLLAGPDIPKRPSSTAPKAAGPSPVYPTPTTSPAIKRTSPRTRGRNEEFHPVLRSAREEERLDPLTVDPTLRLELLAKVQAIELAGGSRNLFQFGQPPVQAKLDLPPEPIVKPFVFVGPRKPPEPPPPPPPPPPPAIPLKYYAYWTARDSGKRTACFIDGDDILMAGEGETLKRRYRVIRINPTSVVMEDLDFKNQQTLKIVEEAAQGA